MSRCGTYYKGFPLQSLTQLPALLSHITGSLISIENGAHYYVLGARTILYPAYSAGFSISEVVNLKLTDIDSERMLIYIRNSKGYKDRYVLLSKVLPENLRLYFVKYKPKVYLFEGQDREKYSVSSIQEIFKKRQADSKY